MHQVRDFWLLYLRYFSMQVHRRVLVGHFKGWAPFLFYHYHQTAALPFLWLLHSISGCIATRWIPSVAAPHGSYVQCIYQSSGGFIRITVSLDQGKLTSLKLKCSKVASVHGRSSVWIPWSPVGKFILLAWMSMAVISYLANSQTFFQVSS